MYINDRITEERNEIVLKHTFEEDENEEEVTRVTLSLFFPFFFFFFID